MMFSVSRSVRPAVQTLLLLLTFCLGASAAAQEEVETLVRLDFQLRHQPADDVMTVLQPLLSGQGRVEIDRQTRRVVVRDHRSNIERIVEGLEGFDHPVRSLGFDVILLRATRSTDPDLRKINERVLPSTVVESLGFMLTQNLYSLVARTELEGREGERVTTPLGEERVVRIAVGTVLEDGYVARLPVHFQLHRKERPEASGFNQALNLHLDKTVVIALASDADAQSGWAIAVTSRQLSELTLPRPGEE
ncbi:MAG: secretin N-terminal domain-containing protein [Acidobacteriota bacterium]